MYKKNTCNLVFKGIVAVLMLNACFAAYADQFGLQIAGGPAYHHNVQKLDLGLVWDPGLHWWEIGGWHFSLVGEGHVAYWRTHGNIHSTIYEVGVTPMLRFIKSAGDIRPYIEAGVGLRLLSHPDISTNYTLSSAFQFTDIVGVGAQFGRRQQYQVGFRFQHISNADIKEPNPGINFSQLYLQYNF